MTTSPFKKGIVALLIILGSLLTSLLLLISALQFYAFNPHYLQRQLIRNQVNTDIAVRDFPLVSEHISHYLNGQHENFQLELSVDGQATDLFGQREIAHMTDVRQLFSRLDNLQLAIFISLAIIVILFFILQVKQAWFLPLRSIATVGIGSLITTLAVFIVLTVMVTTDFSYFFVKFHHLFFSNDLWLLDPATDRLIQLLPEIFFKRIASHIAIVYAVTSVFFGLIGFILKQLLPIKTKA